MDETFPTEDADNPESTDSLAVEAGRNFIQRRRDDVVVRIEEFLQAGPAGKAWGVVSRLLPLGLFGGGLLYAAEHLPGDVANLDPSHIGKDALAAAISSALWWWFAGPRRYPKEERQELLDSWENRSASHSSGHQTNSEAPGAH